jgi:hypothetical protein
VQFQLLNAVRQQFTNVWCGAHTPMFYTTSGKAHDEIIGANERGLPVNA